MKVLIGVSVPAISESYDVLVPDFVPVKDVTALITEAVVFLSNRRYVPSKQEFLCLKEQNVLLQQDLTLKDYKVKHSDHLVLL